MEYDSVEVLLEKIDRWKIHKDKFVEMSEKFMSKAPDNTEEETIEYLGLVAVESGKFDILIEDVFLAAEEVRKSRDIND